MNWLQTLMKERWMLTTPNDGEGELGRGRENMVIVDFGKVDLEMKDRDLNINEWIKLGMIQQQIYKVAYFYRVIPPW